MYGAKYSRPKGGLAEPLAHRIGANSEAFNHFDLVTLASGFLEVVDGTSDRPVGICKKKVTMASDNQTVDKITVPYTPLDNDSEFEMDFDAAAAESNVGQYFTVAGATGTQVVTVGSASATVGQVQLVKLDPRGEGSTLRGSFKVALASLSFTPAS